MRLHGFQLAHFQEVADEEFVRSLADGLPRHHARACEGLSAEALKAKIRDALDRGRRLGMTKKYPLSMVVELMFILGPRFYEVPFIKAALTDPRVAPNARIEALIRTMTDDKWDEARRLSGASPPSANNP